MHICVCVYATMHKISMHIFTVHAPLKIMVS